MSRTWDFIFVGFLALNSLIRVGLFVPYELRINFSCDLKPLNKPLRFGFDMSKKHSLVAAFSFSKSKFEENQFVIRIGFSSFVLCLVCDSVLGCNCDLGL